MEETTMKHLDYLQDCISRMNRCSFQLKGWTITVVTALIALYASGVGFVENSNEIIILVGIFPTLVFWILDSYYLTKESDFVITYNIIVGVKESEVKIKPFEIKPDLGEEKSKFFKNMFSATEAGLYLSVIVFLGVISLVLNVFC